MSKEHHHTHQANKRILLIAFIIITIYMIIEVVGGILTNSLALLSDAGHMLSDSFSLGIALLAFILSAKRSGHKKTFGNKRFEILSAVINGLALLGIAGFIFYEAAERFTNPPDVATSGMLIISTFGLLVNILVAWIMNRGADTKGNLNIRGAFLHVISDMVGSIGAISAALLMMFLGWKWADPLASIFVGLLALRSGFLVTKESLHILMEGTPKDVDVEKVIKTIQNQDNIKSLHDLHIWTITSGLNALSCHVIIDDNINLSKCVEILKKLEHKLEHLGIRHVTIQIETEDNDHPDTIFCNGEKHYDK